MIMSFSTSFIFVELEPLSLKYGLTFFQNSLLFAMSLTFNLAKYCFFVFLKRFRQKVRCLYFWQSKWVLLLLKMFLSFDQSIITSLNSFVRKQLLLCHKIFFLSGACLFNFFKNVVSKLSQELLGKWFSLNPKSFLKPSELNCLYDLYIFSLGFATDFRILEISLW